MAHDELNSLGIYILGALDVVCLGDAWEFICEALSVQVLLGVCCLVLHNFVGHDDVLVTGLFAGGQVSTRLFVAREETL